MLRFVARYGLVRLVGRRVLPALMIWDAVVMANKARQIPIVDRSLRRGAAAASRRATGAMPGRRRPGHAADPEATGQAAPRPGEPTP